MRGPRQRVVAYLGEMDQAGRVGVKCCAEGSRTIQDHLLDESEPEWVEVDLKRVRVECSRQFGGCWLLTSLPRPSGSKVLGGFGSRCASTYPVVQHLADASFVRNLETRVTLASGSGWGSAGVQVVFRVAYLNGKPMDVEYLTHRLLAPVVHPAGIR